MNTLTKSVAAIALMAWSLCALGQTYSITELPTLGGSVFGSAVNDSGQVTGLSYLSDGVTEHAFIYSNGVMQDLGTLGGKDSAGYDINDSGQVTGNSAQSNNSTYHAFIYSNGVMQDLGSLGGTESGGSSINNSGQVAGWSYLSDNVTSHAFYLQQRRNAGYRHIGRCNQLRDRHQRWRAGDGGGRLLEEETCEQRKNRL
jgi:probable HAF family extracellular repeat protein